MDQDGKRRAAAYLAAHMKGWSPERLAAEADIDPGTVRDFLSGKRWPRFASRKAMERAVEITDGSLELVARGLMETTTGDPVEQAIDESELTRANKARLKGAYYDMLDQQQRERGAS